MLEYNIGRERINLFLIHQFDDDLNNFKNSKTSEQCFCGNSYGVYGLSANCNMQCKGNPNEICGGTWANSVYSTQCSQGKFFFERKLVRKK